MLGDFDVKIAAGHLLGGARDFLQRPGNAAGDEEPGEARRRERAERATENDPARDGDRRLRLFGASRQQSMFLILHLCDFGADGIHSRLSLAGVDPLLTGFDALGFLRIDRVLHNRQFMCHHRLQNIHTALL